MLLFKSVMERHFNRPVCENAAILFNGSKPEKRDKVEAVAKGLQSYSWQVEIYPTLGPGHATELASNAVKDGKTVVFAAGGDGTLNETAMGLLDSDVALGLIPLGTVNILAGELGIKKNVRRTVDDAVNGKFRLMDVGVLNNRPFLTVSGIGYDGEVISKVQEPGKGKKAKGVAPYVLSAIRALPFYKGVAGELEVDGERIPLRFLQGWFQNTRRLAYFDGMRPSGQCDDGKIEATIFEGRNGGDLFQVLFALKNHGEKMMRFQATNYTLDLAKPLKGQIDGDPIQATDHVEVGNRCEALKILVPRREIAIFSRN